MSDDSKIKPELIASSLLAQTRLFRVEGLHLRFSNGVERHYERLRAGKRGAVMVVPLLNEHTFLLTREYAAGVDRYELAFPKGLAEEGETPEQAANRELMEEAGYGARKITHLRTMTLAPGYLSHRMELLLAEDLFEQRLVGDEPESIEVLPWSFSNIDALLSRPDFSEARSLAALLLVRDLVRNRQV